MKNIKIFVSYHKESKIIKNSIITPIHVGAANSSIYLDILRDDSGDNISHKNDRYNELTAQYWAWKNIDADYYGFMHYRRHFAFKDIPQSVELSGFMSFPYVTDAYIENIGLDEKTISECIGDCDIVLPQKGGNASVHFLNNEVQYSGAPYHNAEDFYVMCELIVELYPDYAEAVEVFKQSAGSYWCNMFIFRKHIFQSYCAWLFSILEELEERVATAFLSEQEKRMGYFSERLLNVYVIHLLKMKPETKTKYLQWTFVEYDTFKSDLIPAFSDNNVPVTVSCNEYYMPFLGVMLSSMLEHASKEYNYDIIVMQYRAKAEDVTELKRHTRLLYKLVGNYPNASIRFADVSALLGDTEFPLTSHFSVETYFRLFLPKLLPDYDKVVYLDADMVICGDVSKLYNVDLNGNILAAAHDPITAGSKKALVFNKGDYFENLGIKSIYDYFQAGVLVIDLKKMAEDDLCEKMVEFATTHDCEFVDQDVLNYFCQGKVQYIDLSWNVEITPDVLEIAKYAPADMWKEYQYARKNAEIYHFCGVDKPWNDPTIDYSEVFWEAARKTYWYEYLFAAMLKRAAFTTSKGILRTYSEKVDAIARPLRKAYSELAKIGKTDDIASAILAELEDSITVITRIEATDNFIFYGGGNMCKLILLYFDELGMEYPAAIWDRAARPGQRLFGIPVLQPDFISLDGRDGDTLCVITIESQRISDAVKRSFNESGFSDIIDNRGIMQVLSRKLWLKLEEERKAEGGGLT